ncbi:MAG: hypothetical protein U1E48_04590 [Paracoccaceae bacterium]
MTFTSSEGAAGAVSDAARAAVLPKIGRTTLATGRSSTCPAFSAAVSFSRSATSAARSLRWASSAARSAFIQALRARECVRLSPTSKKPAFSLQGAWPR